MAFLFCYRGPDRGGRRAGEEIERKNMQRERERCAVERERVSSINFLGLKISIEYIK